MIFKFTKDEVMQVLKDHVRNKYDISTTSPVEVSFNVTKRMFFGMNLESASVEVKDIKTK